MNMLPSTSEIVESTEGLSFKLRMDGGGQPSIRQFGNRYCIEDDINRLFESIDIRTSAKSFDAKQKKAMKRPIRAGSPQISGIGISEPVSLKQALRGLCISQASEMAAMKRLSRPGGSLGAGGSEVGTIKRLYRSLVVDGNGSVLPLNEGNGKLVEVSLVPEQIPSNSGEKTFEVSEMAKLELSGSSSHVLQEEVVPLPAGFTNTMLKEGVGKVKLTDSFPENHGSKKLQVVDEIPSSSVSALVETRGAEGQENQLHIGSFQSSPGPDSMMSNFACNSPRFIRPLFRNKSFVRKKLKQASASASASSSSNPCSRHHHSDLDPSTSNAPRRRCDCSQEDGSKENIRVSPASSGRSHDLESNSATADTCSSTRSSSLNNSSRTRSILSKIDERSRSRDKGEFSQSSKSSIGEYSSTTSISDDSTLSGSSCSGNRPHMSRDLRWEAIRLVQKRHGSLTLKHFKLIKKLGCGDIGSVHLAALTGTNCLFALKVMDNEFLESRKKIIRAQTEKEILQILDHPFLPTLYAHFVSDKLSCLVMEYCPGGDLHVLRQKQPGRSFSERAARFYIAEILLAIEYLHMLGVVYRDLKPENILVREDGHIMLSDFDLSLRCAVNTVVVQSSSSVAESTKKMSSPCSESSCIDPFCFQPACQASCFTPRLLSVASKSRKFKSDLAVQVTPLPQLVVEPTSARSNSFVGTHEYLAPEIIKGEGHGSAVDWWTFGIFLFELLYGRTPFKGSTSEETLSNVATRSLKFPSSPIVSFHARDLIRGLLVKDPEHRLGSAKGAAEIKQHPFFEGLNWALIRCATPPELPKNNDHNQKCKESSDKDTPAEFEMF